MNPLISATGLTRVYRNGKREVHALRGVDLAVGAGDFVAVMGPSGCGKSTLLHLLGGLDRPTAGELRLRGDRVDGLSEAGWAKLRRREIGYVFQFFNLIGNLTVADNIELPGLIAGLSPREARTRREQLIASLGLEGVERSVPARLSGGQQQRVAIARALINRPAVLLADEPTGNLDSTNATEVMALLRAANAEGQAIVMVTHDARVASSAGRLVRMRDGAIVSDTPIAAEPGRRKTTVADLVEMEA